MPKSEFVWREPNNDYPCTAHDNAEPSIVEWYTSRQAHPELAAQLVRFLKRMRLLGHEPAVVQLYRSNSEQIALWRKGRTTAGSIVTDALPWQSAHCHIENDKGASMAFDIAPKFNGQIYWPMDARTSRFWSDARDTGKMLGLVWGATFNEPPRDFGHFQLSTFKAIKP